MIEAPFGRLRSKERHVQGQPLRPGQFGERLITEVLQEVTEADEREFGFGLRRSGGSDLIAMLGRSSDARLPQGGLADAGLTSKHKRPIRGGTLKEVVDRGELQVPPDDPIRDHVAPPPGGRPCPRR
jgi:hypothetical protein